MRLTINETNRRREKQMRYNAENGITPKQIEKALNTSPLITASQQPEPKPYEIEERVKAALHPSELAFRTHTFPGCIFVRTS